MPPLRADLFRLGQRQVDEQHVLQEGGGLQGAPLLDGDLRCLEARLRLDDASVLVLAVVDDGLAVALGDLVGGQHAEGLWAGRVCGRHAARQRPRRYRVRPANGRARVCLQTQSMFSGSIGRHYSNWLLMRKAPKVKSSI